MSLLAVLLGFTLGGLLTATIAVILLLPSQYKTPLTKGNASVSVQILVLGDIGRSPRMQYHALSIAKHGGTVHLIGYHESPPHPDLLTSPNVTIHPLAPPPKALRTSSIPFIIAGPLKVLWQVGTLLRVLCYTAPASTWLLVQNPPSIPTLAIALLVSMLRNTRLLIDWHNYGWTILSGTKGASHPFVAISRAYEMALGQAAPTANITVTHAMARELAQPPWDIRSPIVTLHDRPAAIFQPLGSSSGSGGEKAERQTILKRIPETAPFAASIMAGATKLIVSSTSWTPDEDFSLLLDALVSYAQSSSSSSQAPSILAIITGRGPQKAHYVARIASLVASGKLHNVQIATAWLSITDYAALLRAADLGVCLHMSSSGVDLPMKVVDMFGSGLPVAAYAGYKSFGELVKEGVNGVGFVDAEGLAGVLGRLLGGGYEGGKGEGEGQELARLRKGAREESSLRWDEEWDRVLGRMLGFIE
ncbi:glycosyltransferase family 33 protein [Astrocystis sublimbata]|nr:glycosyltransferase family 33 protein [Astrocystis sublimbata]